MKIKKKGLLKVSEKIILPGEQIIFQVAFALFIASIIGILILQYDFGSLETEFIVVFKFILPLGLGFFLMKYLKKFRQKLNTTGIIFFSLFSSFSFLLWIFLLNQ